jgi:membrane associated rhomboid family serine protease
LGLFRGILNDTAALGREIRAGWVRLKWRLSWWKRRKAIHSRQTAAEIENIRRSVAASTKMCPECRALIPSSASTCSECGARTSHVRSGGVGRAVSQLLPFEPSVTMLLVTAFFVLYITGFFVSMRLGEQAPGGGGGGFGALMNLDGRALVVTGANYGPLSGGPEPWRLLTAIFLHAGILHLAFNSWALVTIGRLIEHLYGPRKMFVLFIVTGVAGNILSLWWHGPRMLGIGASGAIFGLIGVAAVYGMRRGDALGQNLRQQMLSWAIYGVVMGFLLRADNAAHIGGFLAGAGSAFVVNEEGVRRGSLPDGVWTLLAAVSAIAAAASFALVAFTWAGAV